MENKHITLSDGRKLSYCEYGDKNGFPVLYCHGSQSSRYEMHYDLSFAINNKIRIISIDRPGHGLSDYNFNGSILSFADDANELMNQKGIDKYSILGMSAGAPFAMGIAFKHSENVVKLGIVSGFAPYNDKSKTQLSKEINVLLSVAKSFPLFLRLMLKIQNWQLKRNPKKALGNFLKVMSDADQEILKNKSVMDIIEKMFTEAFRNGSKGVAHEISKILVEDWNFQLNEIRVPTYIWHGSEDLNVPKGWAEIVNEEIPNSKLIIFENEGHLIIFKNAEDIFSTLLS